MELATEKTDLVFLTGKHNGTFDNIQKIDVDGKEIITSEAIKYLGIILDSEMGFGEHIGEAVGKANAVTMALNRMMANIDSNGDTVHSAVWSRIVD